VQTEKNFFFLGNKIKFFSAVLILGSRWMVALAIGVRGGGEDSGKIL